MTNLLQVERLNKNHHVTIPIDGLNCAGSDTAIVERALSKIAGVIHVYVNACTEMAYVEFDPSRCTPYQFLGAIKEAGYAADEFCLR